MGPRRILVFGGSGQVGASLLAELERRRGRSELRSIRWGELTGLESPALLGRLESELRGSTACDLVFANGVTDPSVAADQLRYSNFEFPQQVEQVLRSGDRDLRFLTIGTIMERFPEACAKNTYLNSKQALGQWMASLDRSGFLHVRLHTIYGNALKPHMFLGQMAAAIAANSTFEMSSGEQLREYHHADDIAVSLAQVLESPWNFGSMLEINSGTPLRLADLARGVFGAFGKLSLLKIGAISGASGENKERIFERSEPWLLPSSREPLAGVIEAIKRSLK